MARDRAGTEVGWPVLRYDEKARRDPAGSVNELKSIHAKRAQSIRTA